MQDTKKQGGTGVPLPSPSGVHRSASGKLFHVFRTNALRERAESVFGEKTYAERWRSAYLGATVGSYAAQLVGAALAYAAVADLARQMAPAFPLIFGTVAAVALLIGLEYGKRALGGNLVTAYLRSSAIRSYERLPIGAAILLAAMVALSVASSWKGAELLARQAADESKAIEILYSEMADSLRTHYSQAVAKEEAVLADFKRSVSWRGHIDFSKPETRKVVDRHTEEIARLREELRSVLNHLDTERSLSLSENGQRADSQALIVALISLGAEMFALVCIRFVYVYLFRVFVEAQAEGWSVAEEPVAKQPMHMQQNSELALALRALSERLAAPPSVQYQPAQSAPAGMGFRFSPTVNNSESKYDDRRSQEERPALKENERECAHCGETFTYKHWNAKYCKAACRVSAWEERTGKRFNPNKRKAA